MSKFKVGDWVKIINTMAWHGDIVEIIEIDHSGFVLKHSIFGQSGGFQIHEFESAQQHINRQVIKVFLGVE